MNINFVCVPAVLSHIVSPSTYSTAQGISFMNIYSASQGITAILHWLLHCYFLTVANVSIIHRVYHSIRKKKGFSVRRPLLWWVWYERKENCNFEVFFLEKKSITHKSGKKIVFEIRIRKTRAFAKRKKRELCAFIYSDTALRLRWVRCYSGCSFFPSFCENENINLKWNW